MFTAIASLFANTPVRSDVAMTGEITLRGLVLPIGGLKEKTLAAMRAGIQTVIIPKLNEKDLPDIPGEVKEKLNDCSGRERRRTAESGSGGPVAGRRNADCCSRKSATIADSSKLRRDKLTQVSPPKSKPRKPYGSAGVTRSGAAASAGMEPAGGLRSSLSSLRMARTLL